MIAVDVGNTSLEFALMRKGKIKTTFKLPTASADKKSVGRALGKYKKEKILVCSVVPSVTKIFKSLKLSIRIVGEDIKVPIKCFYGKKQIGQDRLVAAYAAKNIYPKTRMIIDFGTAITLDFLSQKGDYEGGLILPGIGSTLKVFANCALLPKRIKPAKSKALIPKNTQSSINKGISEGFGLMMNSLVKKYNKKLSLSSRDPVVITGGEAFVVNHELDFPFKYKPFLVLSGLYMLHKTFPG